MKKLMACVMIACIGMFCSLGCTKEAPKPPAQPPVDEAAPDADPGIMPPTELAPEKPGETPVE